jgi:phosphatidylinositol alpha-1,6-mannosyltransferase
VTVDEVPIKPLWRYFVLTGVRASGRALGLRPRGIIAGSGLTAPFAVVAARLVGAKSVAYLHGLDLIVESKVYQGIWLPLIRSCDLLVVNSAHTGMLARERGIPAERIQVLHPGVDLQDHASMPAAAFRARFGIGDRRMLLSVGRLTPRKGLAEFVGRSLPDIVASEPDVVLAIIGGEASDALHGGPGGEAGRILLAARQAGVADNVLFLGRLDDADLGAAYTAADCHVFPLRQIAGDVEGFGMVALESAARGLRTVAFRVGGVEDAMSDATGRLVEGGDYGAFTSAILAELRRDRVDVEACIAFASDKSWPRFAERFRALIASLR